MKLDYRKDKDILYIAIEGRIDAGNAPELQQAIDEIRQANEGCHTVLDADLLEYLSSAGLRVILRLKKQDKDLAIINVSGDVYSIFEMTGFTEMITIEKTYPRISVDGCEFIAKGANGAVYRYDSETIVKQYFNRDALPEIKQERENARKAFVLGVNTAIPYGIVRIGEGYGSVTELLNAKSITKLIRENPDSLDTAVKYFVDTVKDIHAIAVDEGELPDYKKWVLEWVDFLKDHLPKEQTDKLQRLVEALPESRYMIHGDYHTNNVMIQNGEALIIDLDTLGVGAPVLELGSMFNAFVGFSELDSKVVLDFLGIDDETAGRFWKLSLAAYIGTDDEQAVAAAENKAKVIGYARLIRRGIRRGLDVEHYKKQLEIALNQVETLEI